MVITLSVNSGEVRLENYAIEDYANAGDAIVIPIHFQLEKDV